MADNGLNIDEKEFMKMKPKEQMCVLYRNTMTTMGLVKRFKFHQKVQYMIIGLLCTGMFILINIHLK